MNIAFLDHSFHAHTKSSHFFVAILQRIGKVDVFYIDPDNVDEEVAAYKGLENYDLVLFWQITPQICTIQHLSPEKVVFIPMYDACHQTSIAKWAKYRAYRFVAFSRRLHLLFQKVGISSFFLQYVPPVPANYLNIKKEQQPTIFIWKRHASWKLKPFLEHLHHLDIQKAICHETTAADQKDSYPIAVEFTNGWYPTHEDYVEAISRCHYYLAPRLYEGIGMSFLEAMGCGLCVLAPNRATMNEYIVDGKNGILFDSYEELSRKTIQLTSISKNARQTFLEIEQAWKKGENDLKNFLLHPPKSSLFPRPWFFYFLQNWWQRRKLRHHKVEDFR